MTASLTLAVRTLGPAVLPIVAAFLVLRVGAGRWAAIWPLLAPGLLVATAALAARFNRGRLVLAVAGVLLAELALTPGGLSPLAGHPAGRVAGLVQTALPALFLALALLPERGFWSRPGLLRVLACGGFALLVAPLAAKTGPTWVEGLSAGWPATVKGWWSWPQVLVGRPFAEVVALALASLALVVRLARRRDPLDAGVLGLLAAWWLGAQLDADARPLMLAAGALAALLGLVEASYGLAFRDALTGLPGRRALEECLAGLGGSYTLAMVDVDHFKKFNDKYGHEAGDEVLRMVARRLAAVGGGGRAFRYGGEEFTVVFPRKDTEQAEPTLERLRASIADRPFFPRAKDSRKAGKRGRGAGAGRGVKVTVSIGAAEPSGRGERPAQVRERADARLYQSKRDGRNRVTV